MKLIFKIDFLTGILISFLISSCSYSTKNAELYPKLIEGEWDWSGNDFIRLKFEDGVCYDPINKMFSAYYQTKSDTLIIQNEDQETLYFRIIDINYDELRLELIGRKLHTMKMTKLRYNNDELVFYKLIPFDSIQFEGVNHNNTPRKDILKNILR